MKTPARVLILKRLGEATGPLAIHQFDIPDVSQNSIGTRLPELAKEGLVESVKVAGRPFKAWRLAAAQGSLPL